MAKSTKHGGVTNAALVEQSHRTGRTPEELEQEEQDAAASESTDGGTEQTVERPAPGDPKAAWVDYAVSQGHKREDAESMTKADLIATYGRSE